MARMRLRNDNLRAYVNRNKRLAKMGFPSYRAYLDSGMWASIRKPILQRDEWRCVLCGERANQVHHRSYSTRTLMGEAPENLFSLCGRCHESVEFEEGSKRRMCDVNSTFEEMKIRNHSN